MNKIAILFSAFVIAILLQGCISVTKELPALTTYNISLEPNIQYEKTKLHKQISLSINEPKALSSVNSKLISYSKNYQNENYALSKWSDSPTKMIQNMMVQYLSNSDNFEFVSSSRLNLHSHYNILSELDSFGQIFLDNRSYATLQIRVFLINSKELYSKQFSYTKECEESNAQGSVEALNSIANTFVKDLYLWIDKTLQEDL
jgi:ABC-type uncharacterized transport system auxiliary subunit